MDTQGEYVLSSSWPSAKLLSSSPGGTSGGPHQLDRIGVILSESPSVLLHQFNDVLPVDYPSSVVGGAEGDNAKLSTSAGVRSSYHSVRRPTLWMEAGLLLCSVFHILQRLLHAGRESRAPTGYEGFHASKLFSCLTQINFAFVYKRGAITLLGQLKPPLHATKGKRRHHYP